MVVGLGGENYPREAAQTIPKPPSGLPLGGTAHGTVFSLRSNTAVCRVLWGEFCVLCTVGCVPCAVSAESVEWAVGCVLWTPVLCRTTVCD